MYAVRTCRDKDECCDRARFENSPGHADRRRTGRTGGPCREAFVGAAGQLLDLLLDALMFREEDYYICNIVKCRPPGNRIPTDDEAESCLPWLRCQTLLLKPRIMVCLGATAMKYIIDRNARITQIRGQWTERKGYWFMPTFHPAALLRDP